MKTFELLTAFGALLGILPPLSKWLSDRSSLAKRRQAFQDCKSHAEFLDTWLRAQDLVSTPERMEELKSEINNKLHSLIKDYFNLLTHKEIEKPEVPAVLSLLKRMFLAYWPHNFSGWVFHIVFYMLMGMDLMALLGFSISPDTNNPSLKHLYNNLGQLWALLVIIIPMIIIQRFARRADRR